MPKIIRDLGRNKLAILGAIIVMGIIITAIFAPYLAPNSFREQDLRARLSPPSSDYPLGTDALGRCVLSRIIFGSRIALTYGIVIVSISALLGITLGLIAGFFGSYADTIIMRLVDITLSFPVLVLALAIVSALGPGLYNVMVVLGIVGWSTYARLVRGQVLSVRETDYVVAARALGASNRRMILFHILPNVIGPAIVVATLHFPSALIAASALSFLGMGAQPPIPCWGAILADGRAYLRTAHWIATFPGIAIMLTVLGFNFIGDGLRDVLDPRLRKR